MKNLKQAAKRIKQAVKKKERIIIYGDSDLDGIASVIVAKEAINNLGGNIVSICFPNRQLDGYGINKTSLNKLAHHAPGLLIAFDFGISNFEEVKIAKKLGFEVIIVDHHQVLDKLPEPALIVNPKQPGDEYPFKEFAAAGLSYYLALELLGNNISNSLKNSFLELTALATIADMMPIEKDNKEIVFQGLDKVYSSWRPGIQALLQIFQDEYGLTRINKMNSLLNIRDNTQEYPEGYLLLTCFDKKKAKETVQNLYQKSIEKKKKIEEVFLQIEEIIEKNNDPIIFQGNKDWQIPVLGVVASILSNKYSKPTFLYQKEETKSQGTVRATSGFNVVKAMQKSENILKTYGGHAKAAGFVVENKNIKKFYNNLIKYFL